MFKIPCEGLLRWYVISWRSADTMMLELFLISEEL
jgi:hypothetical protein